ncbi:uncharacterized protein LOC114728144 isoform X2 [Neltuma alba]|uniref:uncharacterized protein LOC114728144 isoform X2 n=1 Tax=Neltuma alba TaxID=207710 RepID=UPI0010A4BE08|nr:uncharacterized protein LOC114728144 isoform X2 [Prosopis alba]
MRKLCEACAQKCLPIQRKRKKSSNVPSSFFKVMIGPDFSQVLYLPPKFGRTASTLVDEEAIVEDSSGQRWTVQISVVDNSYAFHEGWNAFSLDHGLEVGHFLVFHYMGRSHFVVEIFDKSGCEKVDFPGRRKQKKRKKIRIDLDASEELLNRQGLLSSESDAEKVQSQDEVVGANSAEINEEKTSEKRIQSLYQDKTFEDPCYLKDQDIEDKERENRSPMFDVRYEILNNSGAHRTGKITGSNEIVVTNIYTQDPLLEEMMVNNGANQDPFEVEVTKRSHFLEELDRSTLHPCGAKIPEHLLIPCTVQHEETRVNNLIMPNWEDQKCQFAENSETKQLLISKDEYPLHAGNCEDTKEMIAGLHVSLDAAPMCNVEMERMFQKELLDMTSDMCSHNDKIRSIIGDQGSNFSSVKAEPSDYGCHSKLQPSWFNCINCTVILNCMTKLRVCVYAYHELREEM